MGDGEKNFIKHVIHISLELYEGAPLRKGLNNFTISINVLITEVINTILTSMSSHGSTAWIRFWVRAVLRDQQQFCQYFDLTRIASFSIKQLF